MKNCIAALLFARNAAPATVSFVIDVTPPTLSLVPEDGAQLLLQRPELVGVYSDALSGIDTASVATGIDGTDATGRFTLTASQASWLKDADLAFGEHAFSVSVADRAGNVSAASVDFTIVAPYRYFTLEGEEIRFSVEGGYFLAKLADGVAPLSLIADLIAAGASDIATEPDPFGYHEVAVAAGNSVSSVQTAAKQIPGVEKVYPVVAWPDGRATGTAEGVYVKFVEGTSDADARAALAQIGAVHVDADCCEAFAYLVRASLNDASEDFLLADDLRSLASVAYAAPSLVIRYAESIGGILPDSTTTTQGWLTQAGVQASWPTVYGGGNYFVSWTVTPIGLLGTGVQSTHPSLSGRVLPGYSAFGDSAEPNAAGHLENSLGTAMAGILAANWGSNGLSGITKDSPIFPAKVREYSCGQISGQCFWTTSDEAIKAGAKTALDAGARVLLFDSRYAEYLPQSIAYLNEALQAAADGKGAIAVFPMGDEKHEIYSYRAPTPLNIANTAFVTAVDENNRILERANVHATDSTRVNFAAPGSPILTLDATGANGAGAGDTAVWQGTPMAAAIFAGSASLSYKINPGLTASALLAAAESTGADSEEEIERSPLFRFILWVLNSLRLQQHVDLGVCQSADAIPESASASLPPMINQTAGSSPVYGTASLTFFNSANPPVVCGKAHWAGNSYIWAMSSDKRSILFSSGADEIRIRANRIAAGIYPSLVPVAYRATRSLYDTQPYTVYASILLTDINGNYLGQGETGVHVCAYYKFIVWWIKKCSPAVTLLDMPDASLSEAQIAFKHTLLADSSLADQYRSLFVELLTDRDDFGDSIFDPGFAMRLAELQQDILAAVGEDVYMAAMGSFEDPMQHVGERFSSLIKSGQ